MITSNAHQQNINRALHYIDTHLEEDLSLTKVASQTYYSPYHFHKLFKAIVNESLYTYIKRKRIEKAAATLMRRKEIPIAEIALRFNFESIASFSKAFKKFYGIAPLHFRTKAPSNLAQLVRKNGQAISFIEPYICASIINSQTKMETQIKVLDTIHMASITHIGKSEPLQQSFYKLIEWGKSEGHITSPDFKMGMVYHDSYKITDPSKVRHSVSLITTQPIKANGIIDSLTIQQDTYLIISLVIPPSQFTQAWKDAFVWATEHGYKPSGNKCFEIYHNDFNQHPEKKCIVDLHIPILTS
ncbi:AraC family transcriptional regulator [Aquimarina rhabdastrellae]